MFASISFFGAPGTLMVASVGEFGMSGEFASLSFRSSLRPALSTSPGGEAMRCIRSRVDAGDGVRCRDWLALGARRVRQVGRGGGGKTLH